VVNSNYILRVNTISGLLAFNDEALQLAIAEREAPYAANAFFQKLMESSFHFAGKIVIRKAFALEDIRNLLRYQISEELQADPFYFYWLEDMAEICKIFCDLEKSAAIGFWLGTKRGCSRYHVDNVAQRLLVTYAGKGTEWLLEEAVDRQAITNNSPLELIIKDKSAIRFMQPWDIAIFRGGEKGLLHRSPDAAMSRSSILMRLDHSEFWENIRKSKM